MKATITTCDICNDEAPRMNASIGTERLRPPDGSPTGWASIHMTISEAVPGQVKKLRGIMAPIIKQMPPELKKAQEAQFALLPGPQMVDLNLQLDVCPKCQQGSGLWDVAKAKIAGFFEEEDDVPGT